MIDVRGVVSAALWITGLAISLATWSYARWWAIRHRARTRNTLTRRAYLVPLCGGFALFGLGLSLSGRSWWETGAWALLAVLSAGQGLYIWITRPPSGGPGSR